ncbi:hypothetical protein [Qipengyuania sp. JC766]|uniref:hypothetical protein n=1 Tax=Qipengyuania sp. JC766 TaxID=3232139 RepID=UPI00345A710D
MIPSFLVAALMQVGPNPADIRSVPPPDPRDAIVRQDSAARPVSLPPCPVISGSEAAEQVVQSARRRAESQRGLEKAASLQCLGIAQADLSQWNSAADSFAEAAQLASEFDEGRWRAVIGAQRGHALLSADRSAEALSAFESAAALAAIEGDQDLAGQILSDKARAEVAAGDIGAAASTLAGARETAANAASVWLLSATLARRTDDLAQAQAFIERAAELDRTDPEIALEAGVIAALQGRDDAARRSFDSAVALAPDSETAASARAYLAQLSVGGTEE